MKLTNMKIRIAVFLGLLGLVLYISGVKLGEKSLFAEDNEDKPHEVMFVGVDISGSFLKGKYFDNAISFLAHYIYSHIKGYGDLDVPVALFVGSIGGVKQGEPKTFYPLDEFQYKSVPEIEKKLQELFPKTKVDAYTDFNAFFKQIGTFVRNKKLVMKPISIMLLSDGIPDDAKKPDLSEYRTFNLGPLENLSRNITVRLVYTTAVVGDNWQQKVPRKRVKVWTQDDRVMKDWNSKDIMQPNLPLEKQTRFFKWVKDNVDFAVRAKRVD